MSTDIKIIETQINELSSRLNSLKGQCSLLNEQLTLSEHKLVDYKNKKQLYAKSVELLNYVSEITTIKTTQGFEKIITYALRYIYNSDYKFKLEFGRRGNLSELFFKCKAPGEKEYLEVSPEYPGGGVLNVISIALKIALLELTRTKIKGFLILDESFANLHPTPSMYLENARKFVRAIHEKIGRQIIMITGREEFIQEADNVIKIGE